MQPRADVPGGPRGVHLRDYWKILWQSRYTALAVFVGVVGLTFLRVSFVTPIYEAATVIEIKPEARSILPGQEQWMGTEGGGWLAEEKYFNTQMEVLKSRDIAERVFRQLRLQDHPLFNGQRNAINAFAGMITVKAKVNTRLVMVTVSGTDPKEVREWANAVAETYVKRNVDQATASFRGIMDEIQKGLAEFRTDLGEADVKRMRSAAEAEMYIPESQQEILRQSLGTYNDSLAKLRVESASLSAELDNLDRIQQQGGDLMALSRVAQDPVIQDLNTQKVSLERDLERLGSEKKPRHPEVLSKRSEFEKVEQKIRGQISQIADKLRTQHQITKRNESYLQDQIRTAEEQAYRIKQASTPYEMQKNDADSKRKVYDVVAETVEKLAMGAQLISMNNNVAILDKAVEPRGPVRPRKLLSLAFGAVLGVLLGVLTVLFLDYLDNTVRTPEDIEQYLGLQILGIIPKYRGQDSAAAREAYQSLRTSILFSSQNREKTVLLFSSAGPQEGKSSTVTMAGRALASAGDRVIILDCDLRRPTQHVRLSLKREPGITTYLLDGAEGDHERFVQATDIPTLRFFACGAIPPNPSELLGLVKFRNLVQTLKRSYDWVVIDSPPVASLADSVVLASLADMMALVIKHNENDRELIRRSLVRLRDVKANIFGAVLNGVDLERAYYGDYYYTGYDYDDDVDGKRKRGKHRAKRTESRESGSKVAL